MRIQEEPVIAFLPPAADGEQPIPVVAEKTTIEASDTGSEMVLLQSGARVEDVVQALNAIGATPRDIITRFYKRFNPPERCMESCTFCSRLAPSLRK